MDIVDYYIYGSKTHSFFFWKLIDNETICSASRVRNASPNETIWRYGVDAPQFSHEQQQIGVDVSPDPSEGLDYPYHCYIHADEALQCS